MQLKEAKNLLFYWAENATTTEKVSLFSFTVIVLALTHKLLTWVDRFLESRVNELETDSGSAERTKSSETKPKSKNSKANGVTKSQGGQVIHSKSNPKWWKNYEEDKIVSLDCEFVHLVNKTGIQRIKLATVAIWNFKGKKVYEGKVFHTPGSFIVDRHTFSVNGFEENSFTDGKNLKEVQEEVKKILKDKLIIVFGGRQDFHCLNIDPNDFIVFDLQSVYYSTFENERKGTIKEKHSLQSVYSHYFKKDIRSGIHTASMDAKATMLIFRYGYIQDYENGCDSWPNGRNDIKRIQQVHKISADPGPLMMAELTAQSISQPSSQPAEAMPAEVMNDGDAAH